jgi:hypothetical protein
VTLRLWFAGLAAALLGLAAPQGMARQAASGPQIVTADVERFYRIYDAAHGHPTAADLQRLYLDQGSSGLHDFIAVRSLTADNLAAAIAAKPETFETARQCADLLPRVRGRLTAALDRLRHLYPPARFPPITIVVGRGKSGGTTSNAGVLIGIETLCSADFLESNREDRLVHLIAHEYAHVQQAASENADMEGATVLFASRVEGGAEFIGERTSGGVAYPHLRQWGKGREREVEQQFLADRDKTDLSAWLYNGVGTAERPGDLGYWIGYRIAKAYYERARNKRRALADIIEVTPQSAAAILKGSGGI